MNARIFATASIAYVRDAYRSLSDERAALAALRAASAAAHREGLEDLSDELDSVAELVEGYSATAVDGDDSAAVLERACEGIRAAI